MVNICAKGVIVVIICASRAADGQVIMLLVREGLYPRTHFRVDQTGHGVRLSITITISSILSAEQVERLCAGIETVPGARIQW